MSIVDRIQAEVGAGPGVAPARSWFAIEGRGKRNPLVGHRVTLTLKRPWRNSKLMVGQSMTGTLLRTFCANGRTLIGELRLDSGRVVPWPWSRNYIAIALVG